MLGFWAYISLHIPDILKGLKYTCELTVVVSLITLPLSMLVAILAIVGPKWYKALYKAYTWVFRGSPLLMQLYLVYFGLPYVGIVLPANVVVFGIFVICFTAYQAEVFRGGILSTEIGQYEACKVLGMNMYLTMVRVVIPQTIRKVIPQTCSQVIVLFKDTSLVMTIGMNDLLKSASTLVILDLRLDALLAVLVIYLAISSLMVIGFGKLEKKYATYV